MGIVKRVEEALRQNEKQLNESVSFRELRDFYLDMQRQGLTLKHEYDIPLPDTAGRDAFRLLSGK